MRDTRQDSPGSRPLDFTRFDYLGTRVLLVGLMLAVPLNWLAALWPWLSGDALIRTLGVDGSAPVTDPAPVAGVEAEWAGSVDVTLPDATTSQWLHHLAPDLVLGIAMLLVLVPLWRLIGAVQRGEAFETRSVTRLRVVALTVMLAPWALLVSRAVAEGYLRSQAFEQELTVWLPVSGTTITVSVVGLVIAAVAEAFRRGLRLESDVEGLV